MTLGLSSSSLSAPTGSGDSGEVGDLRALHGHSLVLQIPSAIEKILALQMSKPKHKGVKSCPRSQERIQQPQGRRLPVPLFSCLLLGTKPGKSIGVHIHTYCSVTKDGNEPFLGRAIPNGIHKSRNNFLNEQFWKSVSFLRSSTLEEDLW